jgi:flagellar hook-associated protein 2
VLRGLRNSLRSTLNSSVASGGGLTYLSQAGIEFTQSGTLKLNKAVFAAAVKNGTADIAALFTGPSGTGGAFSALNDLLTSYTQSNGTLSSVQTQLTNQITRMTDQISSMQARLAIQRATLQAEFSAADAAMSQMKSDSTTLSNFASSLSSR